MSARHLLVALATTLGAFGLGGALLIPSLFTGRLLPGVALGSVSLMGTAREDLPRVVEAYEDTLRQGAMPFTLRGATVSATLGDLGFGLNEQATAAAVAEVDLWDVLQGRGRVIPALTVDTATLQTAIYHRWQGLITPPQSASLVLTPRGQLLEQRGADGEGVDPIALGEAVADRLTQPPTSEPVSLSVIPAVPRVQDHEVTAARTLAAALLKDGFRLQFANTSFTLKPATARRLLTFVEHGDPADRSNYVLGVRFDPGGLREYLTATIAPAIDREPINARFERVGDTVTQFALPQRGQHLDVEATSSAITDALSRREAGAAVAVAFTEPDITDNADIESLGLHTLLATGESNFAGSPKNRVHNIRVGAARYHGLLIPPDTEFSFNEFLGPVDAAHGFKPELVIKHNVTTPEYGGGLCQVSTTAFRGAVLAGLPITQRRNHAYPVRYYGTPGFDATIYPPYTDLRFHNNTPGYILIQARIEGTALTFELWGTDDGRQVEVKGPHPFDRQPDGSVKATLTQRVLKDGTVLAENTFYSRYKSPSLFPRVLAADDPAGAVLHRAAGTPSPAPTHADTTTPPTKPKPAPSATAAAKPASTPKASPSPPAPEPTPESE